MSLVNTETGEIVEFDRAAAERRAERITLRLDAIADNYRAVLPMIREAIEKRDDLALGYRSPGEYVADRFGQSLAGLGIEVRRAVVGELMQAGLSTRAIARVVGASRMAVQRDRDAGVTTVTPDPEPIPTPEGEVAPGSASELPPVELATPHPPVTGIDGKTYSHTPRATPRPVAEKSLNLIELYASKAARAANDLTPEQIRRVRPEADAWIAGLRNSIEALQRLVDSLDNQEHK